MPERASHCAMQFRRYAPIYMTRPCKQNLASAWCREKFAPCPGSFRFGVTDYLAGSLSLVCLRSLASALCAGESESDIRNASAAFCFWVWLVASCFPDAPAFGKGLLRFNGRTIQMT